ncbi:MAG TPA: thiol:disulfide interchange protein DsbA/DsbL [Burkholderiales bacterium]|nr:thiol:disulfide interchange protein DsbA/DsbL [Burkholderiales bacterium]
MSKLFAVFAALLVAAPTAMAQGNFQFTELKPPQPVETQGKQVEVIEFFWYGCIHCYNLEPLIETWSKKLPADTQFRRVPAVFNQRWGHDAAVYYTLEAMGLIDKLHRPLFDAIHRDRLNTADEPAFSAWLQKNGVDAKKFIETMKSFGVQSKARRAVQLTTAYKIDGTPAMAVQGRYTVSADQGRSREGLLDTVNYLVEQVRKGK